MTEKGEMIEEIKSKVKSATALTNQLFHKLKHKNDEDIRQVNILLQELEKAEACSQNL